MAVGSLVLPRGEADWNKPISSPGPHGLWRKALNRLWKYYLVFGILAEGAAYVGAVLSGMRAMQGGFVAGSPGPAGWSYLETGMLLAGLPAAAYVAAMGLLHSARRGSRRAEAPAHRRVRRDWRPYPGTTTAEDIMVLGFSVGVLVFLGMDFGLHLPLLDALFAATVAAVGLYRLGAARLSKSRRMLDERQQAEG